MNQDDLNQFRRKVKQLNEAGMSQRQIAKELGKSKSAVGRALKWLSSHEGVKLPGDKIEKDFKKDNACITTKSLNIKTLDDALEASDVDLDVWEVDRYVINSWEVTMGTETEVVGDPKTPQCWKKNPETYTNYQVKVWLKRKISNAEELVLQDLVDRVKQYKPKYKKMKPQIVDDPHLLEICLFDHHFGMMAWREETGEDYDLKIAENFYLNALEDLLSKVASFQIDRILVPFGNDFFHVNDPLGLTPKNHNHLDVDSRLAKIFSVGKWSMISAIDMCRQIAPVDVLWVPGNHDPESSFYLAQVLEAMHHEDSRVHVDCSPKYRKAYKYGVNFIGFAHGDEEPTRELPRIFMDEFTDEWAGTRHREIHTGHIHKKKQTNFVSVDSFGSTSVRVIPSLCSTDAWHYKKGYVGKDRAAQSFLWNKERGLTCSFLTHVD